MNHQKSPKATEKITNRERHATACSGKVGIVTGKKHFAERSDAGILT